MILPIVGVSLIDVEWDHQEAVMTMLNALGEAIRWKPTLLMRSFLWLLWKL
jgi:energy-converting hydrogenase Eha subunit E